MAKPTGTTGPVKLGTDADGKPIAEFQKLEFPKDKDAAEQMIASDFTSSMAGAPGPGGRILSVTNLKQNTENDFDFTANIDGVEAYLELQEAAPLSGPYETASPKYTVGDFAKFVLGKIGDKAAKYPKEKTKPIYLLVYVTDWKFVFSESAIQCLQHWLAASPPPFAGVFLYMPIMPHEGIPFWLYPADVPADFHPNQVIDNVITNLDARAVKGEQVPDGGIVFYFTAQPPK